MFENECNMYHFPIPILVIYSVQNYNELEIKENNIDIVHNYILRIIGNVDFKFTSRPW